MSQVLKFEVSSGLKSVLGGELITDDEVAVFELVKNSFDARATRVDLLFEGRSLYVCDNGTGMSRSDIDSKWLFVAYSSKRKGQKKSSDFRDSISDRKHYAGSKGIGRFASDRLGETVILKTRAKGSKIRTIHQIEVNWKDFDGDLTKHFTDIDLEYSTVNNFDLPKPLTDPAHGTVIEIKNTFGIWDRRRILNLKESLSKLINPFGSESDNFEIFIHAADEKQADHDVRVKATARGEEPLQPDLVNGQVGNFIFSTLEEKTTALHVQIDSSSNTIQSRLIDRGELIYEIREPNPYALLRNSEFSCVLYFLNQSAKLTFARRMGVPSIQFGSVFLFRNGFRVFPVGEENDDWFGMDRRKQQGYARFLGTRDLIGKIDVEGDDASFKEASSRNAGLIETEAVIQLRKCFREHCLIRLERYVVPVTFADKEDKNVDNVSRLLTDPGKARVTNAIAKLVDDDSVDLIRYSDNLVDLISERSAQFESSLAGLRSIAEKTKSGDLFKRIEDAEKRFKAIRDSEEQARKQADQERRAKEEAEKRARDAEKKASEFETKLSEEVKRSLFLTSIASLDTETILNLHHQITIYAVDIQQQIENSLTDIAGRQNIPATDFVSALESISFLNKKVLGVSKFATKANFRLESEHITADLGEFVEQYINGVATDFLSGSIRIEVESDEKGFQQSFKPIDVAVVVDNLISNARRARANLISFDIKHPQKGVIHISVKDNGNGFNREIDDLERIFDKGFTLTEGSGLGLFHVRQVLGEIKGSIEARRPDTGKGAHFLIRIAK